MRIRHFLRKTIRKLGIDVTRYDYLHHAEARRLNLIAEYRISIILDVGANTGQYATHLRDIGYAGRIASFEPLQEEYAALESRSAQDNTWHTYNYALGDVDTEQDINVAENSHSSSLLNVLPRHLESAPKAQAVSTQRIKIHKLDSIYNQVCTDQDIPYLKLDAQGYEMKILNGATKSLERIDTIQLEMSLTPLYQGETGLPEMTTWLYEQGFVLVSMEPGHADSRNGQLLQVDGIFHRFRH